MLNGINYMPTGDVGGRRRGPEVSSWKYKATSCFKSMTGRPVVVAADILFSFFSSSAPSIAQNPAPSPQTQSKLQP